MKTKQTIGPWRVGDAGQTVFGPPNGNPSPETVASVINKANSNLIAAAPELLAACEATATLAYELMERAAKMDRLLIAKDGREPDCELGEIIRLRGQLSRNAAAIAKAKGAS